MTVALFQSLFCTFIVNLQTDKSFEEDSTDQSVTVVTKAESENVHSCPDCNFTSNRRFNMKRHFKSRHTVPDEFDQHGSKKVLPTTDNFLCVVCGKEFKSGEGLKNHTKSVHKKEFRFTCEICDKGFNGLWNYRGHMATHDKTLEERCGSCPATFKYKSSRLSHEKICHGEGRKKVPCSICYNEFANVTTLKEHIKGVHGNQTDTYSCKHCRCTFKWRSSLSYHMKHCKGDISN